MHHHRFLVGLLIFSFVYIIFGSNDVIVKNLKLYVDGEEYWIKGIAYNPVPLGQGVVGYDGGIGGGLCSPKVRPWGDILTACYDSDYFDGSLDAPWREYQPYEGGYFQGAWERDFPLIQQLGVNTLRIYNTNPSNKQATIYYPQLFNTSMGKDHVPFMDMAESYGLKVIFPIIGDWSLIQSTPEVLYKRYIRWQIDEIGNHSALLMWTFGNELPLYETQQYIPLINDYMTYIKQYTYSKWGRRIPVTSAVVDNPSSYNTLASSLQVDIFTANAGYRGYNFQNLWSGSGAGSGFSGWYDLSCTYNIPLFIGEMGWQIQNNAQNSYDPLWPNKQYSDLVAHLTEGAIGGSFFEYSDEPQKADPNQQTMGVVAFSVGYSPYEYGHYSSLQEYSFAPDTATPKQYVYASLQNGTLNGTAYNFNANVFSLLGIPQSTLTSSPSLCSSFSLVDCPADNTCSYHGICNRATGVCSCQTGWTGVDCSQSACPSSCNNRGTCVSIISPPTCSCNDGWTGPACDVANLPSGCSSYCVPGNGNCAASGKCVCYPGWWGSDCSIPDLNYPSPATSLSSSSSSSSSTSSSASTTSATTTSPSTTSTTTTTTSSTTSKPSTSTTSTTSSTSTTTSSTTSKPTTTTSTSTTSSTTSKPTTTTSTTTTSTTSKPTTTTSTTSSTTSKPTTTTSTTSTTCSTQSCGAANYNTCQYTCFGTLLCPVPDQACGPACYDPSVYHCVNGQLQHV